MSFFASVDFKLLNLTISDFEHPGLQTIERYFAPFEFCLTSIVFILFIYISITQSPKPMKSYSFLLIYQVSATYIFDILTITIQPVILLPYIGAYVNGFWQYGEKWNAIIFVLFFLNIIFIFHSIILQMIFRLSSLYTSKNWFYKFTRLKFLLVFSLPFFLFLFCGVFLGFALDQPGGELFRQTVISEYSFFKQLFERHPYVLGYHPNFSGKIIVLLSAILFLSFIIPFYLITFYYFYFNRLKFVKNNLNEKNRNLHVMLLKAMIAQSIILFIFMVLPLEILSLSFIFPYKYGSFFASLCPLMVMPHTLLDILVQLYCIKPYRNWIFKNLPWHKNVIVAITTSEFTHPI